MIKNNHYLKVFKKNNINQILLKKIILLKSQQYKYSQKIQNEWFLKNIQKEDLHILLFFKKKLIGYNVLRKKKLKILSVKNNKLVNFFIFDTLIVDRLYRNKGLSKKIILKSNSIIKKKKIFSILVCAKKMVNYYKKYNWVLLNKKNIKFKEIDLNKKHLMIYNQKNIDLNNKKIFII